MDTLRKLFSKSGVSLYELVNSRDQEDESFRVYVASTPPTRKICTQSEIVSPEFEHNLQESIGSVIAETTIGETVREAIGKGLPSVDYLTILRGGSSFNPTMGLYRIGLRTKKHHVSSQRKRLSDGSWMITQGNYEKLFDEEMGGARNVDLFLGDIVATGTSLRHGLERTFEAMQRRNYLLRSFYFFTIGSIYTERIIQEAINDDKYQQVLRNPQTHVIYLEGRFGVATEETPIELKTPDTDLLTYHEGAIITPEFAAELFEIPEHVLETCVIYDGGKRANNWDAHLNEVIEYWRRLRERAEGGLTLHQAIGERYPFDGSNLKAWREFHSAWRELNDEEVSAPFVSWQKLMIDTRGGNLADLCRQRISRCEKMLRGEY